MEFFASLAKVLVGVFVLFTISNLAYRRWVPARGWLWVALVGALALANMLIHRTVSESINPPFFTALFFGVVLNGIAPSGEDVPKMWCKRAIYSVAIGTLIGWMSYAEIVNA